jgi:hypothetical protein
VKNLLFDFHQEAQKLKFKVGLESQAIHACVNDRVFNHWNIVVEQLPNLSTRSYWIFHPQKGIINFRFSCFYLLISRP